jgi:hypothetical protein
VGSRTGSKGFTVDRRTWLRAGAAALVGGVALLGLAPQAFAAPGDAAATALRIDLASTVPLVGVAADVTLGGVDAPPSESVTGLGVVAALGGATGVGATSGTASATATSDALSSAASSTVQGLALSILGSATSATTLEGTVSCPVGGTPVADTTVVGL